MSDEKWYDKKITFGKKKAAVNGNIVEPKSVKKNKKQMPLQSDRNYYGLKSKRKEKPEFGEWYYYNATMFWVLITVAVLVIGIATFFIFIFEPPIKEGLVTGIFHDDEHIGYYEDNKSVTRTEFYTTVDSDGKSHSKTRQVHDHYEYRVEEHFDGEDHFVQIEQPSKKHEGKILTRYVYITPELSIKEGKWFIIDKDRGDSTRDPNNDITGVTKWSRSHADLTPWKSKEY